MTTFSHISVLLNETLAGLAIKPNGIYIDGTFGRGGHSRALLQQLGANGRLIAIDRDPTAHIAAQAIQDPRFTFIPGPFSDLAHYIEQQGLTGKVDGCLLDLGVSSPQLDDPERGFSFMRDGPLDMRMDPTQGISAADWLHYASVEEITTVLKEFGEERFAYKIARAIVHDRVTTPFTRTHQLASLIARLIPNKEKGKHPATRSFQGIRIHINNELGEITQALTGAMTVLAPQGRLAVISFHSLEDRLVKQFMRRESQGLDVPKGLPLTEAQLQIHRRLSLIRKVKPSAEELAANPRARSAVLRVAERLEAPL